MLPMHENKTQFMQSLHQIFITKNRSYEALPVGEIHGGDKVWVWRSWVRENSGLGLGLQWFENFFKSLRQLHHSQIYRGLSFRGRGEGKIYVEIFNSTNPKKLNEYEKNSKNFIYRNLKQMQKEDQNFSCKLKFLPNRETHKETVDSFNKTSRCHISRMS